MGTREEAERVRSAVRGLMEADGAADGLKPLEHYRGLFAGFGDVVREEHEAVLKASETRIAGATPAGARAEPPTTPLPEVPLEVERVGPYRVLKEIGRGGMGVVYLAEDTRVGRKVALKVLPAAFSSSRHLQARFQREAAIASRLDHPGICTVYEAGEEDGVAFMALRYLEGETLGQCIARSREALGSGRSTGCVSGLPASQAEGNGAVPPRDVDRVVRLVEKVARALHAAHEAGLIHRDIKPGNVMVTKDGEAVLLDFGLAREEEDDPANLTRTGSLMGTPAYMSPEQLVAQRIRLDRRTDVYSLGVALYECLTLKLPFEAPTLDGLYQKILATDPENPRRLNGTISADLRVVIDTALEKDRSRRYQAAQDLAEDLRRVRAREPIRARPVGPVVRLGRWAQRNPAVAASVGGLFLSVTAGLTVSLNLLGRATEEAEAKDRQRQRAEAAEGSMRKALEEVRAQVAEKERANRLTRAMALVHASAAAEGRDGMESLLLAREAVRALPPDMEVWPPEVTTRLHRAVKASKERCRIAPGSGIRNVDVTQRGDMGLFCFEDRIVLVDPDGREIAQFPEGGVKERWEFSSAHFSPAGDRIVTGISDGTVRVWSARGEESLVLRGHEASVEWAEYSPDGTRIVSASYDGTARLWSSDGTPHSVLRGNNRFLRYATFSRSGLHVLGALNIPGRGSLQSAPEGEVARVWDLDGRIVCTLGDRERTVQTARFSPRGDLVLTRGRDNELRVWNLGGVEVATVPDVGPYACGAFDYTGEFLYVGHEDGTIGKWTSDGKLVSTTVAHPRRVQFIEASKDARFVVSVGGESVARLWEVSTMTGEILSGFEETPDCVAVAPDGRFLLTGNDYPIPGSFVHGCGRFWRTSGLDADRAPPGGGAGESAAFLDGGNVVLSLTTNGELRHWDRRRRTVTTLLRADGDWATFRVSPSGDAFATHVGHSKRPARNTVPPDCTLWSASGTALAEMRVPGNFNSFGFSPDGALLLLQLDTTVALFDRGGASRLVLAEFGDPVRRASFSPKGDRIHVDLSTGRRRTYHLDGEALGESGSSGWATLDLARATIQVQDQEVLIRDEHGVESARFPSRNCEVGIGADSHRGRRGIIAYQDGLCIVLDSDGKELTRFTADFGRPSHCTVSPDGSRVLVNGRLLDGEGKQILGAIKNPWNLSPEAGMTGFSPDGKWFIGRGEGGAAASVEIWGADGRIRCALPTERGTVECVRLSPRGDEVLTLFADGAMETWTLDPAGLLALVEERCTRNFSREERLRHWDLLGAEGETRFAEEEARSLVKTYGVPSVALEEVHPDLPDRAKSMVEKALRAMRQSPLEEAMGWLQVSHDREGDADAVLAAVEKAEALLEGLAEPDLRARCALRRADVLLAGREFRRARESLEAARKSGTRDEYLVSKWLHGLFGLGRHDEHIGAIDDVLGWGMSSDFQEYLKEGKERSEENLRLRRAGLPAGRWVAEYRRTGEGVPDGECGLLVGDMVLEAEGKPCAYPNTEWEKLWEEKCKKRVGSGDPEEDAATLRILRKGVIMDVRIMWRPYNFVLVRYQPRPLDE